VYLLNIHRVLLVAGCSQGRPTHGPAVLREKLVELFLVHPVCAVAGAGFMSLTNKMPQTPHLLRLPQKQSEHGAEIVR
jgi:hypothetical protein